MALLREPVLWILPAAFLVAWAVLVALHRRVGCLFYLIGLALVALSVVVAATAGRSTRDSCANAHWFAGCAIDAMWVPLVFMLNALFGFGMLGMLALVTALVEAARGGTGRPPPGRPDAA